MLILGVANADWADQNGFTFLMLAALNGYDEVVQFLVDQVDVTTKNADGYTALSIASWAGCINVADFD